MRLPWVRRALARLQKPRWSVALPGKTLENCQWIYATDTSMMAFAGKQLFSGLS